MKPDAAIAHIYLAEALLEREQIEEALAELAKAEVLVPECAAIYTTRAAIFEQVGLPELAQRARVRADTALRRPYPSGGAIHELEFYLAVGACDGLASGFYHYRGTEHALTRLEAGAAPAQEMLADAASAWGQPGQPPQCLIVLASRLPRLAWKYEAIAYKISLMNAGVVLQSLYLVRTELGLNGSAVGSGRPSLFAAATNTSSWGETSIAEFVFGSRPGRFD